MKRGLVLVLLALGCFLVPQVAHATYYEITNAIFTIVYSPASNQAGQPTTNVYVGPSGSVIVGTPTAEGDSQPMGIFGVGVALAPLGGGITAYTINFGPNFSTYDSSAYDTFEAVITQGGYLWTAGSSLIGGYSWGGANYPGREDLLGPFADQTTVVVTPASDYFLNIVLRTTEDTDYPSWGSFSDVRVMPIPEPTTMLLLGSGILGLAGLGFRRKKK